MLEFSSGPGSVPSPYPLLKPIPIEYGTHRPPPPLSDRLWLRSSLPFPDIATGVAGVIVGLPAKGRKDNPLPGKELPSSRPTGLEGLEVDGSASSPLFLLEMRSRSRSLYFSLSRSFSRSRSRSRSRFLSRSRRLASLVPAPEIPSKLFKKVSFIFFSRSSTSPRLVSIGPLVGDTEAAGGDADISGSGSFAGVTVAALPAVTVVDDEPVAVENLDDGALGIGDKGGAPSGAKRPPNDKGGLYPSFAVLSTRSRSCGRPAKPSADLRLSGDFPLPALPALLLSLSSLSFHLPLNGFLESIS
ncbi:hypothetical protein NMY22_g7228 [Coprinellus aureogranulatus]|nr:hypothetical protein NMY22_g7228 [Coprinellus aureogranulatus]